MIQVQNWIIVACTYNMIVKTTNTAIIPKDYSINNNLQKPDTKTKILDLPLRNLPGTYILDYWKRQFNIPVDDVYVFRYNASISILYIILSLLLNAVQVSYKLQDSETFP